MPRKNTISAVSIERKRMIEGIVLFIICLILSYVLTTQNIYLVTGTILGVLFFTIGFISPMFSLYLLIFAMLLSPEFGARDISGGGFTIRFEDLLLIMMGFAWLAKAAVHKDVGLAINTVLNKPIFIYVIVCTLATLFGIIVGDVKSPLTGTFFVLKFCEYFVVFFLTINNVNSRLQLKRLLFALFVVYIIVLIVGFSQIPGGGRISAPFEGESTEPNTLGGYLIIMLSLNIALIFNIKNMYHKTMLTILALLCFAAILYTLSRSTWLALFVTYFFLIIFIKKRQYLIFVLLVGALLSPFILPDTVTERAMYTFAAKGGSAAGLPPELRAMQRMSQGGGEAFDSSTSARLGQMSRVARDFKKRPILGYGVTGYSFIDAQYHRVLIETGIVGIIAFFYLLWKIATTLYKIRRKYHYDPLYNSISMGALCAFLGLLIHCIGTNSFVIVRIMEPFWCIMGLNMAIPIIENDTEIFSSKK